MRGWRGRADAAEAGRGKADAARWARRGWHGEADAAKLVQVVHGAQALQEMAAPWWGGGRCRRLPSHHGAFWHLSILVGILDVCRQARLKPSMPAQPLTRRTAGFQGYKSDELARRGWRGGAGGAVLAQCW